MCYLQRNGRPTIEFVKAPAHVEKGHNCMRGMNFVQVDLVINAPNLDLDKAACHQGTLASSSAAPLQFSLGSSSAVHPQTTVAEGFTPPNPVSAGNQHRGGRPSCSVAPSTPQSLSPHETERVTSGPQCKGILPSSISRHDP